MTTTDTAAVDNGVNVEALLGAREHLTEAPELAKFTWRATLRMGERHPQPQHVQRLLRARRRITPTARTTRSTPTTRRSSPRRTTVRRRPEIVLGALASCLTAGVATVATHRGVQLRSVTATIEGDMDLQGILGIDGDVRNGFDGIKVTFEIDADASKADIEAIVAQSQKRSAVFDIVANPTTIQVEVA